MRPERMGGLAVKREQQIMQSDIFNNISKIIKGNSLSELEKSEILVHILW